MNERDNQSSMAILNERHGQRHLLPSIDVTEPERMLPVAALVASLYASNPSKISVFGRDDDGGSGLTGTAVDSDKEPV